MGVKMTGSLQLKNAPIALQNFVHAYVKADLLPFAMIYVDKTSKRDWEVTTLPWGPNPRETGDLLPLAMYAGLFDSSYHFRLYKWTKSPFLQNWMKHCKFLEKKNGRYFPYAPVERETDGVKPADFQVAVHAACYALQYDWAVVYRFSSNSLLSAPEEAKIYAFSLCKDPLLSIWDNYRYLLRDRSTTEEIEKKLAETNEQEFAELWLPLPVIFQ